MLKKLLFAILTFFVIGCTNSSMVKQEPKVSEDVTIYYIHRDGCPACIYMDNILKNQEVKSIIDSKFKLVTVDINNQDILPKSSMITGTTPTFYYLDSNNKEVAKSNHTLELEKFKAKLNSIK